MNNVLLWICPKHVDVMRFEFILVLFVGEKKKGYFWWDVKFKEFDKMFGPDQKSHREVGDSGDYR